MAYYVVILAIYRFVMHYHHGDYIQSMAYLSITLYNLYNH